MRDEGVLLEGDELLFEWKTQKITAVGNIRFTRGTMRLLADRLVYQRTDGTYSADNVRVGQHPFYAEAFSAEGTRDRITLRRAHVTFGEPSPFQPTSNADTITYTSDGRIESSNLRIGIGHTQPLPFPKFQQNLAQPFVGAASFTGGYRRSLGVFADALLLVPVSPAARLGANVGLFSERGIMVGPAGRYQSPGNPEALRGSFRSGYINDHGEKGIDILGRRVPEERAYIEWQHEQVLAPNLSLTAQANWWKDSEVLRDFRPRAFFPVQEPDTFVEAVYAGRNYFVSAFARFQPNSFHRVQERLPEVRFDLLPLAVGHGFYERFQASAAVLREDPLLAGTTLRSDRLDAYYAIERPFAWKDTFAFTPVAGGRVTHYSNTEGAVRAGSYTRTLGELGFDSSLRASGTFAYQNDRWKIDGLRHLITPRVSYRYIPKADRGRARIPQIDRQSFSTYLQPLGLGDRRNIDDLQATNTLRVGLDNTLQTRDRATGTRDLVILNLANDFRYKRQRGERDISETHLDLSIMPAHWLQLDVYQSFAPQTFTVREVNSAITIKDGNAWSVRFSNNFLRREIEDYLVDGRLRINESFEAQARLHYDARKRRFNEQSYGIVHNLGNIWLISYAVSLYSGRVRESSFGFNVQIDTVRF